MSRISVEIVGSSSELQTAVADSADSLKNLASVILKTTQQSVAAGDDARKSNVSLADSFAAVLADARKSAEGVIGSATEQAAALTRGARESITANDEMVASLRAVASEASRSATAAVTASNAAVTAAGRRAKADEDSAARTKAAFGSSSSAISKGGKLITEGLLGAAAASVYLAAKYQSTTTQLMTQAGLSTKATAAVSKGILQMAGSVGQTPTQLADGMFHVASSLNNLIPPAQRVTTELGILKVAADGAAVGGSDMASTTYVLSAAMNALGQTTVPQASKTMAELNAIVGAGDMHLQDLNNALSTGILASAKTFGVSLQSVGSALDVLADKGIPAQKAATSLRMALIEMAAPTTQSAKILESVGLSSTQALAATKQMTDLLTKSGVSTTQIATDLRRPDGFLVALDDLRSHLESTGLTATGAAAVISRAFGGIRGATVVENLYQSLNKLQSKYKQIGVTTSQFNSDITKTHETLGYQIKATEADFDSLAITIGTSLIPPVEHGLRDLNEFVQWLEKGSVGAKALEGAVTAVGSALVASFAVSKVKGAISLLGELAHPFGTSKAATLTGAAGAAPASTLGSLTGAGMMIGGSRGTAGLPGTPANPIVVAIEAGEYTGLGSQAASGTVAGAKAGEATAATEGEATAAAAGVGETAAVAETAAGAGVAASIAGSLKGLLPGLLKGGMIAGVGTLASQAAGGVIGGKAGKDVSTIGTYTAGGAALGSLIGPEGTVAGALGGALIGSLESVFKSPSFQQKLASSLTASLPGGKQGDKATAREKSSGAINTAAKDVSEAAKLVQAANKLTPPPPHVDATGAVIPAPMSAATSARQTADYKQAGNDTFNALKVDWSTFTHQSVPEMTSEFITEFSKAGVTDRMRDQGAQDMLAYVEAMKKQGKIGAPDAVSQTLQFLEAAFPSVSASLKAQGVTDAKTYAASLAAGLDFTSATNKLLSLDSTLASNWQGLAQPTKQSWAGIVNVVGEQLSQLQDRVQTSTGKTKTDAENAYDELRSHTQATLSSMVTETSTQARALASETAQGVSGAAANMTSILNTSAATIKSLEQAGVVSVQQGDEEIHRELLAALKGLGVTSSVHVVESGAADVSKILKTYATGGLVQFGQPGAKGRDTIHASIGSQHVVVGSGEVAAVLTGQQQQVANRYLAPVGGLTGLFKNVSTPHYMASGGIVDGQIQAPDVNMSGLVGDLAQGVVDKVAAAANKLLSGTAPSATGAGGSVGSFGSGPWKTIQAEIAKAKGWSLAAWNAVIADESHGNPNARNPSSGAYGIGQFLGSTAQEYAKYGALSPDPSKQIVAMAQYISDRYRNPTAALAHENALHWYDRGGIVNAATGLLTGVKAKAATVAKPTSKPKVKKTTHPKGNSKATKVQVAATVTDLAKIPGYADLIQGPVNDAAMIGDNESTGLTGALAVLGDLQTSASDGAGPAANSYFLNPSDVSDMGPYLNNLQAMGVPLGGLSAGMSYAQAYAVYKQGVAAVQRDIAANGSTDQNSAWQENLGDIQQVLDYVGSDPGHRILTAADMGILGTAQLPDGMTWKQLGAPGQPLDVVEGGLDNSLITLYQQMIAESGGLETRIGKDIPAFTKRAANVLKTEKAEAKRYTGINAQIDKLKLISAKNSLAQAEDAAKEADSAYSVTARKSDLSTTIAGLAAEIAAERAQPIANTAYINQLTQTKAAYQQELSSTDAISTLVSAGNTQAKDAAAVTAKKIALEELELRQSLTPIEADLQQLGGSKTTAGTPTSGSSVYGTLQGYITALTSGLTGIETNSATARGALPKQMIDLQLMASNLGSSFDVTSFNPIDTSTAAAATDDSALEGLQAQQILTLTETLSLNEAQTAALSSMLPQIPRYEKGGPVLQDGLIYAHQGEHVVPKGGTLVGGGAPSVTLQVDHHYHGKAGDFMKFINHTVDTRVSSGPNLLAISKGFGRRTRMLAGAPGGGRGMR